MSFSPTTQPPQASNLEKPFDVEQRQRTSTPIPKDSSDEDLDLSYHPKQCEQKTEKLFYYSEEDENICEECTEDQKRWQIPLSPRPKGCHVCWTKVLKLIYEPVIDEYLCETCIQTQEMQDGFEELASNAEEDAYICDECIQKQKSKE